MIPPTIKVLLVFTLILLLNRLKLNLGLSMTLGGLLMGFWFGLSPSESFVVGFSCLLQRDTLLLIWVVVMIVVLSGFMEKSGDTQSIVRELANVIRSARVRMAMLPAIIGLLPMPGGAIFSAPMVNACDGKSEIKPARKAAINYWFRHMWEYWWPLYPGVILAFDLSGLEMWQFFSVQIPLTFISVTAGSLFLLRGLRITEAACTVRVKGSLFRLVYPIIPIILTISGTLILYIFKENLPGKFFPISVALVPAIAWMHIKRNISLSEWKNVARNKKIWGFVILVIGIRLFSRILEADLSSGNIVAQVKQDMDSFHVSLLGIAILIPFLSGIITGLAIGFVGASFPIVMGLLSNLPPGQLMAYTMIAYASGYMGMLLSPVHICLLVTNEYFSVRMSEAYRFLIRPVFLVLAGAFLFYYILVTFIAGSI